MGGQWLWHWVFWRDISFGLRALNGQYPNLAIPISICSRGGCGVAMQALQPPLVLSSRVFSSNFPVCTFEHSKQSAFLVYLPSKYRFVSRELKESWMPAFAGMTESGIEVGESWVAY